jgi:hypothetical protein
MNRGFAGSSDEPYVAGQLFGESRAIDAAMQKQPSLRFRWPTLCELKMCAAGFPILQIVLVSVD